MKKEDADKVMDLFRRTFRVGEEHQDKFYKGLLGIVLSNSTREPRIDWISEARNVALNIAEDRGRVSIIDVLDECPLPDHVDPRVVGGVFRHSSFERIDDLTIQTDDGRYKTVGVFRLQNAY